MILGKWDDVLDIPEGDSGTYKIRHSYTDGPVKAYNLRTSMFGQPEITIPFEGMKKWHKLSYEGGVWMTDLPIEQQQHDSCFKKIKEGSSVLVGGLGLGYAVTKLVRDLQCTVKVIEISQDVANLVWNHLGEDVRSAAKLQICDLMEFVCHNQIPFDYAFYDIWQSDGESTFHEIVRPLRKWSRRFVEEDVICWNEDIMRGQLKNSLQAACMVPYPDPEAAKETRLSGKSYHGCWSIPFWRQYYAENISRDCLAAAIRDYVDDFEMYLGWEDDWNENCEAGIYQ